MEEVKGRKQSKNAFVYSLVIALIGVSVFCWELYSGGTNIGWEPVAMFIAGLFIPVVIFLSMFIANRRRNAHWRKSDSVFLTLCLIGYVAISIWMLYVFLLTSSLYVLLGEWSSALFLFSSTVFTAVILFLPGMIGLWLLWLWSRMKPAKGAPGFGMFLYVIIFLLILTMTGHVTTDFVIMRIFSSINLLTLYKTYYLYVGGILALMSVLGLFNFGNRGKKEE